MAQVLRDKIISPSRIKERTRARTSKRVYPEGSYGATLRNIHMAPNKMRLVADQIRGLRVERARETLRFSRKRAAYYLDRVLLSALGNADTVSQGRVGAGELYVADAYCDEGARLRRFKSGPMGRARPIRRRLCHVSVVLREMEPEEEEAAAPAPRQA